MFSFTRPKANETPYISATLMSATWQSNSGIQDGVTSDLEKIRAVLTDVYNFQYVLYTISKTSTTAGLIEEINKHADSKDSNHLFVFHYSGHGTRKGNPTSPLLLESGSSESERVNYNEIHQALHSLACDVLVVLDCCYATNRDSLFGKGSPETSLHGGKKMIFIGACNAGDKTAAKSDRTLTARLCTAIRAVDGHPASVAAIRGELDHETSQGRKRLFGGHHEPSRTRKGLFGCCSSSRALRPMTLTRPVQPPETFSMHFAGYDESEPRGRRDIFLHKMDGAKGSSESRA